MPTISSRQALLAFALLVPPPHAASAQKTCGPPIPISSPAASPASTPPSSGAMPIYIEEFFLSEAVRSEDRGELQFTVSTLASRLHASAADGISAGLDVEFGITNRLQLSLEVPYGITASTSSEVPAHWSSVSPGLVYQFVRSSHPFALSLGAYVGIPLHPSAETSFIPELLAAKAFGKLQIHTSVEPEFSADGNALEYNIAAVRPLPHKFFPTLEFNGRRDDGNNSFYITPGLYRHLPGRVEIGAAMPLGAGAHSSPIGAVFKLTIEFGGDDDDDTPKSAVRAHPHK